MYCPLQEAYQVPTFASKRRRGSAQDPSPSASASFDPMGIDEGASGRAPAYRRYTQEDFVAPPVRSGNANNNMNRDVTGSPPVDVVMQGYAGQAGDIQYYSQYGMPFPQVSPTVHTVEGFLDSDGTKCAPQDTTYRIPISDETKKAYTSAFNVALTQTQGVNTQYIPQMRTADMSKVKGFYDEDLENYLKTSDIKAAPGPTSSSPPWSQAQPPRSPTTSPAPISDTKSEYKPETSPFASAIAAFKGDMTPAKGGFERPENMSQYSPGQPYASTSGLTNDYLMDLILFILCGVLIIFVCDQLYRLAVLTGMRDTLEFIRPYVQAYPTGSE